MADYIERERVREEVKAKTLTKYDWSEEIDFEDFVKVLDGIPAADVAPVVHSRWILHKDGSGTCRNCKRRQLAIWDMDTWQRYCGDCGAKMDLVVDGE